jgi:hypothetical protein
MRLNHGIIALMLSAAALGSASAITGCAGDGLVYDSYGHQYHRWDRGEERFYRQWEIGTRRGHMDFQRRNPGDQRSYWNWRHRSPPAGHGRH